MRWHSFTRDDLNQLGAHCNPAFRFDAITLATNIVNRTAMQKPVNQAIGAGNALVRSVRAPDPGAGGDPGALSPARRSRREPVRRWPPRWRASRSGAHTW
jgi:hypothetical protein